MIAKGESNADVHNLLGWCWLKSNDLTSGTGSGPGHPIGPSSVTNYLDLARMQLAGRQLDAALESAGVRLSFSPHRRKRGCLRIDRDCRSEIGRRRDILYNGSAFEPE